jgi:YjbE family integral membrane protein
VLEEVLAFLNIVFINMVMSGDNALMVAMAAASLPADLRKKAIFYGMSCAVVILVICTATAAQLLQIKGLTFVGGLLLAWICWRMWGDLREGGMTEEELEATMSGKGEAVHHAHGEEHKAPPSLRRALTNIILVNLSMSVDNVLAVAGAARGHLVLLVIGLSLSVAMMAVASLFLARLLIRYTWIGYIGLVVIIWVCGDMLWRGGEEIWPYVSEWLQ